MNPLNAGYSGTPLDKKMGFQPGDTIYVADTPGWYSEWAAAYSLELEPSLPATHAHIFFNNRRGVGAFLKQTDLSQVEKSLWVSWPKQASKVKTDLTEQTFRDLILPLGWVDTKVAAIDDTWSGLKFLRRKH
jgi:hypothetical protein